jgi:FkbM family methyltransferase
MTPHQFYSQFISHGSLVFDIGANVGNKTQVFRDLGAKVVAVEPHPDHLVHLRNRFPDILVVPKAVGRAAGRAEMGFGGELNLASLSPKWIESVSATGRFGGHVWDHLVEVELTTLDNLAREYGTPDFVKIDVEGYESEVLGGLSRPLKALSFEFTPEHFLDTVACVDKLISLGQVEFNYSPEESMQMRLSAWTDGANLLRTLSRFAGDRVMYGDVYARFL